MISRRELIAAGLLSASGLRAIAGSGNAAMEQGLAALERAHGGHLGVAILDVGTGQVASRRGDERFAMCSTWKWIAAGFVLARVDRGAESLTRRMAYSKSDLIAYSPVTERHVGDGGMTLGALCEAAVTRSDNTAANLLLDSFGGPAALTGYIRSQGDTVTRLDRREPALNVVPPGDLRDTTTPVAMARLLRTIVLGTALSAASRARLAAWLVANTTGDQRLRAGLPKGWRIGDKTGTYDEKANDVAIAWPPGRAPLIITGYYAGAGSDGGGNAVLADVGRIAATA